MSTPSIDRSLVNLDAVVATDVEDILGWVNNRKVVGNLAAFSGTRLTREQELAYIRRMTTSNSDQVWSVRANEDKRYIGQVGIHAIHARSKVGRLACIIAREQEMGRGFGSAAISNALDCAFAPATEDDDNTGLGLHKVWLMAFASNERARKTYARIGFVEEGLLRDEYFHEGEWHDMVRMSLLASEWKAA